MSKKRRRFTKELKFAIFSEAIKGQRQIAEIATECDVHPNQIPLCKRQFLEQGASVFWKKENTEKEELQETQEDLFKKFGQQQYEIDWLKTAKVGIMEKRKMITQDSHLTIFKQCELLYLAKSTNYYRPKPISERDMAIMNRIDDIFTENPDFGSRQLKNMLRWQGLRVDGKTCNG